MMFANDIVERTSTYGYRKSGRPSSKEKGRGRSGGRRGRRYDDESIDETLEDSYIEMADDPRRYSQKKKSSPRMSPKSKVRGNKYHEEMDESLDDASYMGNDVQTRRAKNKSGKPSSGGRRPRREEEFEESTIESGEYLEMKAVPQQQFGVGGGRSNMPPPEYYNQGPGIQNGPVPHQGQFHGANNGQYQGRQQQIQQQIQQQYQPNVSGQRPDMGVQYYSSRTTLDPPGYYLKNNALRNSSARNINAPNGQGYYTGPQPGYSMNVNPHPGNMQAHQPPPPPNSQYYRR